MYEALSPEPSVEQLDEFKRLIVSSCDEELSVKIPQDHGTYIKILKDVVSIGDAWLQFYEPLTDTAGEEHVIVDSYILSPDYRISKAVHEKLEEISIPELPDNILDIGNNWAPSLEHYHIQKQDHLSGILEDPKVTFDELKDVIEKLKEALDLPRKQLFNLVANNCALGQNRSINKYIKLQRFKSEKDNHNFIPVNLINLLVPIEIDGQTIEIEVSYGMTDFTMPQKSYTASLAHPGYRQPGDQASSQKWQSILDSLYLNPPVNVLPNSEISPIQNILAQLKTINDMYGGQVSISEQLKVYELVSQALEPKN